MADAQQEPQNWTINTLREYFLSIIGEMKVAQERRFDDMEKSQNQRHAASQAAISLAFSAQETAMQAAFAAQKLSVDAALAAAERAGVKSETYSEKRFDLVAEKIDSNMIALSLKIDANFKELSNKIELLATATTQQSSQKVGLQGGWTTLVGAMVILGIIADIVFRLVHP